MLGRERSCAIETDPRHEITMTDQTPQTPQEDPATPPPAQEQERPALGDTVGTGTSIALGCVAATLLLIVLALLFLVVAMVLG